jgi:hypothetical protein
VQGVKSGFLNNLLTRGFAAKSYHSMTARYGKTTAVPPEFALPTAKPITSDKVVMREQAETTTADETYYINGPNYDAMVHFIRHLSVIPTLDPVSKTFKGDQKTAMEFGKWSL